MAGRRSNKGKHVPYYGGYNGDYSEASTPVFQRQGEQEFGGQPGRHLTMSSLARELEEEVEAQASSAKQKQFCTFGKVKLQIFHEDDERTYRPLRNYNIDLQQKCLLDNIWMARNSKQKLEACCALQFYLSKVQEKPLGKQFSFYALATGIQKGIYCRYESLSGAISVAKETHHRTTWKGFFSFHEAFVFLTDLVDEDDIIFIEREPRDNIINGILEAQLAEMEEDLKQKQAQINELSQALMESRCRAHTQQES